MLAFRCAMVYVKTRMDPMNVPVHQDTKWPVTVVPVKVGVLMNDGELPSLPS